MIPRHPHHHGGGAAHRDVKPIDVGGSVDVAGQVGVVGLEWAAHPLIVVIIEREIDNANLSTGRTDEGFPNRWQRLRYRQDAR